MKLHSHRQIARVFATHMAEQLPEHADIVTHIPTANTRVRQRGFDHAKLIARAIARKQRIQHRTLLTRTNNSRQVGSGRRVRLQQADQLFRARADLSGNTVVLIDDVVSTGATIESAARCLRIAGARKVCVMTVAYNA